MVILLGAAFGSGLVALTYGLRPPRRSLVAVLTALGQPTAPQSTAVTHSQDERPSTLARLGSPLTPALRAVGLPTTSLRADLAVAERSVDAFLAAKAACAAVGLLLPWAASGLVTLATGGTPGWWIPSSASLVLAAALFFLPDGEVRQLARQRREELRHTLAVVLDLAVIALAGGAGTQQALHDATTAPQGWAAGQLRRALAAAQATRTSPWQRLGELGHRMDVVELTELAAVVSLAGTEGARIRASLEAKAVAMRRRQLTDAEAAAQSATERMALPVIVQFLGFLVFIGTPALAHVLAGL
ncbi:type II secretion system F family protein [Streptomyces sp. 4N509B]|uniref:type II secretion system F family protein n=1 Tax=Streptomyces sp. 4N509B TaxID=3457413 RepID=UPI003FD3E756